MPKMKEHQIRTYLRPWDETDWTGDPNLGQLPPCEHDKPCGNTATQILIVEIDGKVYTGTFYCDDHAKKQDVDSFTYGN